MYLLHIIESGKQNLPTCISQAFQHLLTIACTVAQSHGKIQCKNRSQRKSADTQWFCGIKGAYLKIIHNQKIGNTLLKRSKKRWYSTLEEEMFWMTSSLVLYDRSRVKGLFPFFFSFIALSLAKQVIYAKAPKCHRKCYAAVKDI